jgi:hypothetical protein
MIGKKARHRSDVVLKGLHTLFRVGAVGGLTDGQLLERFLRQRDDAGEAAFRALIWKARADGLAHLP